MLAAKSDIDYRYSSSKYASEITVLPPIHLLKQPSDPPWTITLLSVFVYIISQACPYLSSWAFENKGDCPSLAPTSSAAAPVQFPSPLFTLTYLLVKLPEIGQIVQ